MVVIGGGCDLKTGLATDTGGLAHNRLWLAIAKAMGHEMQNFGTESLCEDGALALS